MNKDVCIISRQLLADNFSKNWRLRYGKIDFEMYPEQKAIYKEVQALGDHPDPNEIDRIVGNNSWTAVFCNWCGKDVDSVSCCDQYDGSGICKECCDKQSKLLDNKTKKYSVWQEGFRTNGEEAHANCLGEYESTDFKSACVQAVKDNNLEDLFDEDRLTVWGCRLFSTEKKARKAFG